jgi:uncharacterized protein YkwD
MKRSLLPILIACLFVVFPASANASPESRMLCLVNNWRASHDLHSLRVNDGLREAAGIWTMHLIASDTFTHGDMGARLARYYSKKGYDSWAVGEILTYQSVGYPRKALRAWLNSPGHRKILSMKGWRDVGIDRRLGLFRGWFVYMWCIDFGRRH